MNIKMKKFKIKLDTKIITREPQGEIEILNDGEYNVSKYSIAKVNTENTIISKFFNTEGNNIDTGFSNTKSWIVSNYFKKYADIYIPENISRLNYLFLDWTLPTCPRIVCGDNVTSLNSLYKYTISGAMNSVKYGLKEIDLSGLNTSNVTDMTSMFEGLLLLTEDGFDLSLLNTKNVTTMGSMFASCKNIVNLDLSSFDTKNLKSISNIVRNCDKLETIDLSNWNTSNLNNMYQAFYYDTKLNNIIGLEKLDTSNVENMSGTFYYNSWEQLDLNSFNTSKVKDFSSIFYMCTKLKSLKIESWDTSSATNMSSMFCYTGLEKLNLSNFNTSNVTNMGTMFRLNTEMTDLDISNFNMEKVVNIENMFENCNNLINLNFGNNLGKGYTQTSSNYSKYKLNLSVCTRLTYESLIDIITKLYDLNKTYTNLGQTIRTQSLTLGAVNKAKLTDEEIAIATAKGWVIS